MSHATDWFRRAFGPLYSTIYAHRDDTEAEEQIAALSESCALPPDALVLDLGCGNGRHLAAWSRRRIEVIGLELSPHLLDAARARHLPGVVVVPGDMREIPFIGLFDLVTSLFSSFGYFADPADDLRVLSGIARALRPEGRLVIDHVNPAHLKRGLVPASRRTVGDLIIEEKRRLSPNGARVEKELRILREGHVIEEYVESLRLIEPDAWPELLARAGLGLEALASDLRGTPQHDDAPRLTVFARRLEESPS